MPAIATKDSIDTPDDQRRSAGVRPRMTAE